jgi:hypothetical protein
LAGYTKKTMVVASYFVRYCVRNIIGWCTSLLFWQLGDTDKVMFIVLKPS